MSTRKDQLLRRMSGKKGRAVALTREEKALRDVAEKLEEMGGGGADLNAAEGEPGHVKNRTHYEETVEVYGDTLTWDGNTEGLATFNDAYKVSEIVPPMEEVLNHGQITYERLSDGATISFEITEECIDATPEVPSMYSVFHNEYHGVTITGPYVIAITEDFTEYGVSKGLYFVADGRVVTKSLTIPGYTGFKTTTTRIKTIDPKFLPDIGGVDVTAEVGQTIVVEEVDANGKPTKWKAADYQPRTHWSEISRGDILPETTFTPTYDSSLGCTIARLPLFKLELGKTYTVLFDGVEYNLSAFAGTTPFNFIAVGNTVFAGGENTGEPFAVAYLTDLNECAVLCMDANEHTVQVIGDITTYHKIPSKYVGGGAFYLKVRSTETGVVIFGTPNEIDDALNNDSNVILRWIWSDRADMFLPFACRDVRSDGRRTYLFYGFCALTNQYEKFVSIETAEGSNELEYYVEGET